MKNRHEYFFTADLHFQHINIIKHCSRPFKDIREHDKILKRLNGAKILVVGTHDHDALKYPDHFAQISLLIEINVEDQHIVLCHYAMRVWARSHYNSWHLYGHSHSRLEGSGKSFDVGVDGHHFFPWSFKEIKQKMSALPDNFNLVKK